MNDLLTIVFAGVAAGLFLGLIHLLIKVKELQFQESQNKKIIKAIAAVDIDQEISLLYHGMAILKSQLTFIDIGMSTSILKDCVKLRDMEAEIREEIAHHSRMLKEMEKLKKK